MSASPSRSSSQQSSQQSSHDDDSSRFLSPRAREERKLMVLMLTKRKSWLVYHGGSAFRLALFIIFINELGEKAEGAFTTFVNLWWTLC
ncbi:hypothetical protein H8959_003147 [Pygathrix nigripes]